jgi:DNA-binding MarR family transcriptional regulator
MDDDAVRLKHLLIEIGKLHSMRDPMAAACADIHLTKPQIHAMGWLRLGTVTMGQLADHLGITEKTATGVVDRLEREGLVRRQRDETDRRVICVHLTRAGKTLAERLDKAFTRSLKLLLGLLDQPSRKALFQVLERLLSQLPPKLSKAG